MANDFVVLTDSCSDLSQEFLLKNDIKAFVLPCFIDSKEYEQNVLPAKDFYDLVRSGKMPSTSQVNYQIFYDEFKKLAQQKKNILYIGLSSGLSGTANNAVLAAKEIIEEFPEMKIRVVDSLCASLGQGLLVFKALEKKNAGLSLDDLADYLESIKLKILHIVTVDDLMHLKRGGRLSATSAIAGTLLGIKPIIFVNDQGKLENYEKVRGRKASLDKLVTELQAKIGNNPDDTLFISHGDCQEDAEYVMDKIKSIYTIKKTMIECIGPVVGSHAGPGVVAVFMMGESRQ